MPQPASGSLVVTGSLLVQDELLILQRRWRKELPDNDTFALYYDLISGDLPRDKPHTIADYARHSRQSIERFYKSLGILVELGYINRNDEKVPGRTRPVMHLQLLNLSLETVPQALAPAALPEVVVPEVKRGRGRPPKALTPRVVDEESIEIVRTVTIGWGNHPIKKLNTMLDELQHVNPKNVAPSLYLREVRDGKVIVNAYDCEDVARCIAAILREERHYWQNRRLGTSDLLKKLPKMVKTKGTHHDDLPSKPATVPSQAALSFFGSSVPGSPPEER